MSRKKVGNRRNQCMACGEYFNSLSAFDAHRFGNWGNRECMTPEDMKRDGMRLNKDGFWTEGGEVPWHTTA